MWCTSEFWSRKPTWLSLEQVPISTMDLSLWMNQLRCIERSTKLKPCSITHVLYEHRKIILIILPLGQNGNNIFAFHVSFRSFYESKYFVKLLWKCKGWQLFDRSCTGKSVALLHRVSWYTIFRFPQFLEKKLTLKIYMKHIPVWPKSMNTGSGGTIRAPLRPPNTFGSYKAHFIF